MYRGAAEDQELGQLLIRLLATAQVQSSFSIGIPHVHVCISKALEELYELQVIAFDGVVQYWVVRILAVLKTQYLGPMLFHLLKTDKVTAVGRLFRHGMWAFHLLQVVDHLWFSNRRLTVGALLYIFHAVIVVELKGLLGYLFRAGWINRKFSGLRMSQQQKLL